ncbi:mannose-1-phosphate guanylyltransferase [Candidatus Uhrbacteria bacterium]|nr:mannose-1-phosphate guanylyltransferase [Candidatus Uhrbacteria bacterium]
MASSVYAIVLAGGQGTRLWPLSRRARPKQVMPHPLTTATTLLGQTIERLTGIIVPSHIRVVTSRSHEPEVRRNIPSVVARHMIIEEEPRGTAPAIALAAATILRDDPDAIVVTINSDAFIRRESRYQLSITRAIRIIRRHPRALLVVGMPARSPDSGLGYIVSARPAIPPYPDVYRVARFFEKPTLKRARALITAGNCYWNPTIIVGHASRLWESIRAHAPQIARGIVRVQHAASRGERKKIYHMIPAQSIDVGILEKEKHLWVLRSGDIGWSDIGQWATVHDILTGQTRGSVVSIGAHIDYDSSKIMAYNTTSNLVATVGLTNAIIIATNDVILVVDKRRAQDVKRLVAELGGPYAKFR